MSLGLRSRLPGIAYSKVKAISAARGHNEAAASVLDAEEVVPSMEEVKTLLKEISEELKQFVSLTSATSSGFANVISTHYFDMISILGAVYSRKSSNLPKTALRRVPRFLSLE